MSKRTGSGADAPPVTTARAANTATLRVACAADCVALVAIDTAASAKPWSYNQFVDSLAHHTVLVLEDGGEPCGFVVYSRVLDEVELLNVAVTPRCQSRGYGEALVTQMIADNRLCARRVLLEVRASNQRAMALYQRLGFTALGVRKGYYPPVLSAPPGSTAEDAWVMCCEW